MLCYNKIATQKLTDKLRRLPIFTGVLFLCSNTSITNLKKCKFQLGVYE